MAVIRPPAVCPAKGTNPRCVTPAMNPARYSFCEGVKTSLGRVPVIAGAWPLPLSVEVDMGQGFRPPRTQMILGKGKPSDWSLRAFSSNDLRTEKFSKRRVDSVCPS